MLDLADELISNLVVDRTARRSRTPRSGISTRSPRRAKEAFNLAVKLDTEIIDRETIAEKLWEQVETWAKARETELGPLAFFFFARHFYLEEIDAQWIDHLKSMDQLREGIGLRGYGQKDPKIEYKKEGFEMFRQMMERISAERGRQAVPRAARAAAAAAGGGAGERRSSSEAKLPEFKHKERRMVAQHAAATATGGDGQAGGGAREAEDGAPRSAEGRSQRALPVRQRQEVQEVPRRDCGRLAH